ncbi:VirB3 family type IV secretion system protein [Sinorhizobium meliloti]|uniref:VirB3 family type IV secretion system protein n=1 Tax=Rhizobium meliloti TaxID=382 RepID=UPI000FE0DA3E|nr:VirB3 family type IV secretion system protein [Sinorhizobium meliloti]RVL89309.1 hypothetical protein CN136_35090 [Sinorhizobium meliloti]
MQRTTLFIGLTREVTFAGLPILHLVVLICVVMLGFVLTGSLVYLLTTASIGYGVLRALAAYDPKVVDLFIATVQCTRMSYGISKGEGMVYRA